LKKARINHSFIANVIFSIIKQLGESIGKGGFGSVHLALNTLTGFFIFSFFFFNFSSSLPFSPPPLSSPFLFFEWVFLYFWSGKLYACKQISRENLPQNELDGLMVFLWYSLISSPSWWNLREIKKSSITHPTTSIERNQSHEKAESRKHCQIHWIHWNDRAFKYFPRVPFLALDSPLPYLISFSFPLDTATEVLSKVCVRSLVVLMKNWWDSIPIKFLRDWCFFIKRVWSTGISKVIWLNFLDCQWRFNCQLFCRS